ncbi:RWD domain protein (Gir2), putative [Talaromyces stipitatus ATCC 10500]|uniref:RWD domain protein (Gir2), putative n=1 Tax=Talaromyces stipitatus (strain ATCC 10500 / CBS 375.48 / QM 6759 / NRRL 1006) TaxID=441959 RepID=B8LWF4_TALSN|nr:RWD domain protein (Gir2), putative [Talaromyces stipitatus ATCC 10500]EED24265.1 RWD domain protein (Gir2), putative [Talaromyces stipitatus ATCC 10500]
MGREDQVEEREVLDSIFPEEITDLSDTSYRITIKLDVDEDEENEEAPTLLLQVSYPEAYPDVAPDLEILTPPNSAKHTRFDIQEDKAHLMNALQPSIEENLGMAMIFTLVSTLKEAAETLIMERVASERQAREREIAQAEEEENRKFQGTLVNRERFLEWRERFMKEMEEAEQREREEKEAEEKKKKPSAREEQKLTGRQLWERGLAGKGDYDEEGEEEVPSEGVEKLQISS